MLKNRLIKIFGDKISIVTLEKNSQQVIVSENCLHEQTLSNSFEFCIESVVNKAAMLIREEVYKKIEKSRDVTRPPTIEKFIDSSRKPPDIVETFLLFD